MTKKTPLTPDQVRQRLQSQGKTVSDWAREHGYDRQAVYRVMGGLTAARYGRGHEIAVALGLKVPESESSVSPSSGNTHTKASA